MADIIDRLTEGFPESNDRSVLFSFLKHSEHTLRFIVLRRGDLQLSLMLERRLVSSWQEIVPMFAEMHRDIEAASYESLMAIGMTGFHVKMKGLAFLEAFKQLENRIELAQATQDWKKAEHAQTDEEIVANLKQKNLGSQVPFGTGILAGVLKKIYRHLQNVLHHINSILESLKNVSRISEIIKEFKECLENLLETRQLANES